MLLFIFLLLTLEEETLGIISNENSSSPFLTNRPRIKLRITPEFETRGKTLLMNENESLNISCTVIQQNEETIEEFDVDWKFPPHFNNRWAQNSRRKHLFVGTRVEPGQGLNAAWIFFEKLLANDTGSYKCIAVPKKPSGSSVASDITLTVKHKITYCGPEWFECDESGACISQRYLCDGKRDCKEGQDESTDLAGCSSDPCIGKIKCHDRCIDPAWCCDDHNCGNKTQVHYPPRPPYDHRYTDMHFLQTTIYTVVGCAMMFMMIVSIVIVAICRVQLKRALLASPSRQNNRDRNYPTNLNDLDVYLTRPNDYNTYLRDVNITYNINNGAIQFLDCTDEQPPPYFEVVPSVLSGPPPPYTSIENLPPTYQNIISDLSLSTSENQSSLSDIQISPSRECNDANQSSLRRENSLENCVETDALLKEESCETQRARRESEDS